MRNKLRLETDRGNIISNSYKYADTDNNYQELLLRKTSLYWRSQIRAAEFPTRSLNSLLKNSAAVQMRQARDGSGYRTVHIKILYRANERRAHVL